MAKYLDENGLLYFWQQIKTKFAGNAFSKVRVTNSGTNTDLEADSISDTLTITNGNDITLTPTANTDTVQIIHANSGVTAASKGDTSNQAPGFGGTFKVTSGTVNARGHLTAFADHTVTIPNAVASSSSAGLMSAADKTRLDGLDGEYIELPENPANGNYLKYNGTAWVADDIPEGAAASSTTPKMDGTAAVGTENAFARGDHVHPTDTSRQAKITASGILKGNGSGTVTAATAGTDYQAPITFDGTYNASTNKAATVSTVTTAIEALDGVITGTPGATKTLTAFSQTDGKVTATFGDITFPDDEIFIAEYTGNDSTSTPYSDILAAYNAGKVIFGKYANGSLFVQGSYQSNIFRFDHGYGTNHQYLTCSSTGWALGSTQLAPKNSPTFTGTPAAPTPTAGDSSTQIATTEFVAGEISGKIDDPSTKTSGQYLKYNGTDWEAAAVPAGTVTSVRVQATSPVSSSVSTAQTGSLNTTISLANGYGDTKNPYAAKAKNLVLAGPSTGSNAVPAFRALVADDIPSIPKSKISDFPDLANIYKYKGSVAAYADLPATGLTAGDVYDVQSDGMNYAWTGTAWDALGMSFTITSITNAEIDAIVAS